MSLGAVFMNEIMQYNGKLFQILQKTIDAQFQVEGKTIDKHLEYEMVRRPPGVRALVVQNDKILLSHEYRYELDKWDYRLPGGKVFNTNDDYCDAVKRNSLMDDVIIALKKELLEEVSVEIENYFMFDISYCGLKVEWDLYYFLIDQFTQYEDNSIQKSEFEYIENQWFDFSTALKLCLNGSISEKRTAYEIIRYIFGRKER